MHAKRIEPRRPMGRPPLPPEELRGRLHIRLAPATLAALDTMGQEHGLTRTQVVELLILGAAEHGAWAAKVLAESE